MAATNTATLAGGLQGVSQQMQQFDAQMQQVNKATNALASQAGEAMALIEQARSGPFGIIKAGFGALGLMVTFRRTVTSAASVIKPLEGVANTANHQIDRVLSKTAEGAATLSNKVLGDDYGLTHREGRALIDTLAAGAGTGFLANQITAILNMEGVRGALLGIDPQTGQANPRFIENLQRLNMLDMENGLIKLPVSNRTLAVLAVAGGVINTFQRFFQEKLPDSISNFIYGDGLVSKLIGYMPGGQRGPISSAQAEEVMHAVMEEKIPNGNPNTDPLAFALNTVLDGKSIVTLHSLHQTAAMLDAQGPSDGLDGKTIRASQAAARNAKSIQLTTAPLYALLNDGLRATRDPSQRVAMLADWLADSESKTAFRDIPVNDRVLALQFTAKLAERDKLLDPASVFALEQIAKLDTALANAANARNTTTQTLRTAASQASPHITHAAQAEAYNQAYGQFLMAFATSDYANNKEAEEIYYGLVVSYFEGRGEKEACTAELNDAIASIENGTLVVKEYEADAQSQANQPDTTPPTATKTTSQDQPPVHANNGVTNPADAPAAKPDPAAEQAALAKQQAETDQLVTERFAALGNRLAEIGAGNASQQAHEIVRFFAHTETLTNDPQIIELWSPAMFGTLTHDRAQELLQTHVYPNVSGEIHDAVDRAIFDAGAPNKINGVHIRGAIYTALSGDAQAYQDSTAETRLEQEQERALQTTAGRVGVLGERLEGSGGPGAVQRQTAILQEIFTPAAFAENGPFEFLDGGTFLAVYDANVDPHLNSWQMQHLMAPALEAITADSTAEQVRDALLSVLGNTQDMAPEAATAATSTAATLPNVVTPVPAIPAATDNDGTATTAEEAGLDAIASAQTANKAATAASVHNA